ncbi:MAG: DUF3343 domain-containing protein [Johnsonella sp.]|nr:DUF3343 domain-containing protein [Johnsonella sp.]
MQEYLATFHTHLSAMITGKKLKAEAEKVRLEPVPRKLSSSCGTCVRFEAKSSLVHCMDKDYEALYQVLAEDEYLKLA